MTIVNFGLGAGARGTRTPSWNRGSGWPPLYNLSTIFHRSKLMKIEEWIYNYNRRAIGRNDARGLGFVIRDEAGRTIGVAAGYSWAGTSELKQMWIDETYRGPGYTRELLNAFVAEAANRGFRRIWVASYDFQSAGNV